jgi:hypothetical protein
MCIMKPVLSKLVTMDALLTQRHIAEGILDSGGDYLYFVILMPNIGDKRSDNVV